MTAPATGRSMTPVLALRIFLPFALGYYLSYLFRTVNAVIAPDLVRDVGVDAAALGLLTATYFLTFAAFQLPLGILLDKVGPRRTEAALLVFAALGSVVFGLASSPGELIVGRALIGFGVSACLMAAFKSFVAWFDTTRLPLINGCIMAAGGLGALTATAPVEAALGVTDWRGVFFGFAVLALLAAVAVLFIVPERPDRESEGTRMADQLAGIGKVFTSPVFWRVAPMAVASQAAFMGILGLWAGPWLKDIGGLARGDVAATLLLAAAAMIAGYLSVGYLATRLGRLGIPAQTVAAAGMALFIAPQLLFVLEWTGSLRVLFLSFGFLGTTGIVCYAGLSQSFPQHLTGRVNTGLNLLVFGAAFAAQWGIGAVVGLFPETAAGGFAPAGYQAAFTMMIILQVAALAWFVVAGFIWRRPGAGGPRRPGGR